MATGGTKSTLIDKKHLYVLVLCRIFCVCVLFFSVFMFLGSVVQADVLRSTFLSYTMNTAVVKLHRLQNTQKSGLNYFITGGIDRTKKSPNRASVTHLWGGGVLGIDSIGSGTI